MRRLPVDHLVYAVPDLEVVVADVERQLGVRPGLGGRHEGLGTWNALLSLGEGVYLELIAKDPAAPEPSGPRPFGLDELETPRLVTWAVRSTEIEADAENARLRGFDPGRVIPMSRKQPGGETLEWRLSLRADGLGDGLVPFLIDWGSCPHPSALPPDGCRLVELSGFCAEPTQVQEYLRALGTSLRVSEAERPGLRARIEGPAGQLELT